jgi:hypothetical protein
MNNCAVCGRPMKLIPSGYSKSTGKPYNAFYACEDKSHKQPKAGYSQPYQPTPQTAPKEANWDKISYGKCKYGFLIELLKVGDTLDMAEPIAEKWADAAMRKLGQPEMRNYGQGEVVDQVPFPDSEIPKF